MPRKRRNAQSRSRSQDQEQRSSSQQEEGEVLTQERDSNAAAQEQMQGGGEAVETPVLDQASAEQETESESESGGQEVGDGGHASAAPEDGGDGADGDGGPAPTIDAGSSDGGGGGGGGGDSGSGGGDSGGGGGDSGSGGGGGAAGGGGGGGAGGSSPTAGMGNAGAAAGEAATEQAALPTGAANETFGLFSTAMPSQQAAWWADMGGGLSESMAQEEATFQESLPSYDAVMVGEGAAVASAEVATPAAPTTDLESTGADPGEPEMAPTEDPGAFQAETRELSGFSEGEEADTDANAEAISDSLSSTPTSDGDVRTSPGPTPNIPLEGATDPAQVGQKFGSAMTEAGTAAAEAAAAVAASPGAELVQPLEMKETYALEGLASPTNLSPTTADGGMVEFQQVGLSGDVVAAFDQFNSADMQSHLADAQTQIDQATVQRDTDRQTELTKADAETQRMVTEAQSEQESAVTEQRQAINTKRQETVLAQQTAVAGVQSEAQSRQSAVSGDIQSRIATDQAKVKSEFEQAQSKAEGEVSRGERDAERKKREAEREAENQSWWERAANAVASALSSLANAISSIFDAIRSAVNAIIDGVKALANSIIDAACSFINDAIAAFGTFLQGAIQGLLGDVFPELADALCSAVDAAVEYAQEKVNQLGQALKDGIAAMCDAVAAGINAVLSVYETAIQGALAVATAVVTGDWEAALLMALEAALKLAGINPEEFYSMVGSATDTVKSIVENPGTFLGNCIDAVATGFGQFSDNFLSHLQTGFVEWMTGTMGGAGIEMPETLDMGGVLSIVMQVMGLSYDSLREKAVEHLGEENVERMEFVWGFIESAISGGLEGLWEHVQSHLDTLWDSVIGAIQDYLMEKIIMAAVTKIATMFNPVGAIVQALITAWNLYCWVRDQIQRIMGVVTAVVEGLSQIAMGNIGPAANRVEGSLAGLVPVAIDLLANILGLGGISEKVQEIVASVQQTVSDAIDAMIERVKGMFTGGGSDSEEAQEQGEGEGEEEASDYDGELGKRVQFDAEGESHSLWIEASGTVMVASTPMTAENRFADWSSRIQDAPSEENGVGGPHPDDRANAQSLIGRGQTELAAVNTEVQETIQASDEDKNQQDQETELAEDQLASTLRQLFIVFTDEVSDDLRGNYDGPLTQAEYNTQLPTFPEASGIPELKARASHISSVRRDTETLEDKSRHYDAKVKEYEEYLFALAGDSENPDYQSLLSKIETAQNTGTYQGQTMEQLMDTALATVRSLREAKARGQTATEQKLELETIMQVSIDLASQIDPSGTQDGRNMYKKIDEQAHARLLSECEHFPNDERSRLAVNYRNWLREYWRAEVMTDSTHAAILFMRDEGLAGDQRGLSYDQVVEKVVLDLQFKTRTSDAILSRDFSFEDASESQLQEIYNGVMGSAARTNEAVTDSAQSASPSDLTRLQQTGLNWIDNIDLTVAQKFGNRSTIQTLITELNGASSSPLMPRDVKQKIQQCSSLLGDLDYRSDHQIILSSNDAGQLQSANERLSNQAPKVNQAHQKLVELKQMVPSRNDIYQTLSAEFDQMASEHRATEQGLGQLQTLRDTVQQIITANNALENQVTSSTISASLLAVGLLSGGTPINTIVTGVSALRNFLHAGRDIHQAATASGAIDTAQLPTIDASAVAESEALMATVETSLSTAVEEVQSMKAELERRQTLLLDAARSGTAGATGAAGSALAPFVAAANLAIALNRIHDQINRIKALKSTADALNAPYRDMKNSLSGGMDEAANLSRSLHTLLR